MPPCAPSWMKPGCSWSPSTAAPTSSSVTSSTQELDRIGRAARAAQALGAEHLVVGGGARRVSGLRQGDFDALARALDRVEAIARGCGLRAHYHPHLSTIVERPDEVRRILAMTEIGFCPDTAHLAAAGGIPAEMVREHAGRISYVHLKGWQREPFAFTPVDEGDCDNVAVLRALAGIGYRGWITNELDSWPDPSEGARRSLAFVPQARAVARGRAGAPAPHGVGYRAACSRVRVPRGPGDLRRRQDRGPLLHDQASLSAGSAPPRE